MGVRKMEEERQPGADWRGPPQVRPGGGTGSGPYLCVFSYLTRAGVRCALVGCAALAVAMF